MKYLNTVLGIISLCTFLFYLTGEVDPLESDFQSLSSKGSFEFVDGKIFYTIHDTISLKEIRTLQRVNSLFELQIIDPEQLENIGNPNIKTRAPP